MHDGKILIFLGDFCLQQGHLLSRYRVIVTGVSTPLSCHSAC